jgi:hypothetical protein
MWNLIVHAAGAVSSFINIAYCKNAIAQLLLQDARTRVQIDHKSVELIRGNETADDIRDTVMKQMGEMRWSLQRHGMARGRCDQWHHPRLPKPECQRLGLGVGRTFQVHQIPATREDERWWACRRRRWRKRSRSVERS